MSDFTIVFIHGYTSSHTADWYPAISLLLDKAGIDYIIPDLPGGNYPHADEWLATIHEVIKNTTKSLVFVGHSLGTRAVLLYLERYRPKVELVLLIAAFANRVENGLRHNGETYPDFFTHSVDLKAMNDLSKRFVVIHSIDDSSIPYDQGVEIAHDLGAEMLTLSDKDHITDAENATEIFAILKKYVGF